ncbi:DUF2007 domain-containing protein [Dyadobacter sp. 32]|uniref:putative signal transducing protein n=1 Tax=Dyadobacter sp. 32 TaxID=538966 RepID=UPI0011F030EC
MEDSWIKVFESKQMIQAEIARERLEENEIAAVIVNKQDSLYPVFGMCEVHVPSKDSMKAQTILSDEGPFTDPE